jgi:hypothetical protein
MEIVCCIADRLGSDHCDDGRDRLPADYLAARWTNAGRRATVATGLNLRTSIGFALRNSSSAIGHSSFARTTPSRGGAFRAAASIARTAAIKSSIIFAHLSARRNRPILRSTYALRVRPAANRVSIPATTAAPL